MSELAKDKRCGGNSRRDEVEERKRKEKKRKRESGRVQGVPGRGVLLSNEKLAGQLQ